jgi:hypothetical protein
VGKRKRTQLTHGIAGIANPDKAWCFAIASFQLLAAAGLFDGRPVVEDLTRPVTSAARRILRDLRIGSSAATLDLAPFVAAARTAGGRLGALFPTQAKRRSRKTLHQDAHEFITALFGQLESDAGLLDLFSGTLAWTKLCDAGHECPSGAPVDFYARDIPITGRHPEISALLATEFVHEHGVEDVRCDLETCAAAATKRKATITRAPEVLLVHLKRGGSDGRRISTRVRGLDEPLSITVGSAHGGGPPTTTVRYVVEGVVMHTGSNADCGHYTALRQTECGTWVELNDDTVSMIDGTLDSVASAGVTMLVYRRQ